MKAFPFEKEEVNFPKYFIYGKDIGVFDYADPQNKADQCDDCFRDENNSLEFKNDPSEKIKQEIKAKEQVIKQLIEKIRTQNYQALDIKTEIKNLKKKEVKIKEKKRELEKEKEIMESELIQLREQLPIDEESMKPSFFYSNITNKPKDDQKFCVVCMNKKANHALVPCGHMSYCGPCCKKLKQCGICRKNINTFIQIFD